VLLRVLLKFCIITLQDLKGRVLWKPEELRPISWFGLSVIHYWLDRCIHPLYRCFRPITLCPHFPFTSIEPFFKEILVYVFAILYNPLMAIDIHFPTKIRAGIKPASPKTRFWIWHRVRYATLILWSGMPNFLNACKLTRASSI